MAEMQFSGFDDFADKLERIGKFDEKSIKRIADAGAKIALAAYKTVEKFGKDAAKKLQKDKKGYYIGFEGKTVSGYATQKAAYVYEFGRHGNGKRAYHKGAVTNQPKRPFIATLTAEFEPRANKAMQEEFEKILDET